MPAETIAFFKRVTIQPMIGRTLSNFDSVRSVRDVLASGIVNGDTVIPADMPTAWLSSTQLEVETATSQVLSIFVV